MRSEEQATMNTKKYKLNLQAVSTYLSSTPTFSLSNMNTPKLYNMTRKTAARECLPAAALLLVDSVWEPAPAESKHGVDVSSVSS